MKQQPELTVEEVPTESLIPYARNAKIHTNEQSDQICESIGEFGFNDPVAVWDGTDGPEIIEGHGRVMAAKKLGLDVVPVVRLDHLSDEQRRAYGIVHNKLTMNTGWDFAKLDAELEELAGEFDMADFGFDLGAVEDLAMPDDSPLEDEVMTRAGLDFESKSLPYGAERLRTDHAYNLDLVSRLDCGRDGFPKLSKADARPAELQGFNYAKSTPNEQKRGKGCHFFIDDYQFERLWNQPSAYLGALRGYDCVLTPDFSLYMDMPDAMQQWNRYRSAALGKYWAENGLTVVPTLSWAQPSSYKFCFKGIPKHSTVATSTVGVVRDKDAQAVWFDGMREAMRQLQPSRVLLYGKDIGFDFGETEVIEYANGVTERMDANGR